MLGALMAVIPSGCAPWNAQTRVVPPLPSATDVAPGESAYIESNGNEGPKYGCSFIEFDGKGGFLDYNQLRNAKLVLKKRAITSNVLLVIYCHGWNNNAQSDDVIQFMSFLRRLSITKRNLRVEGVYLSWRGSQCVPVLGQSAQMADRDLYNDFNHKNLDNPKRSLDPLFGDILYPVEFLSYFSIKDRAELHVSRVELARAVFDLAFTLKSPTEADKGHHHFVFVLGHSFGALVLEQAIGQASVGLLTSEWDSRNSTDRWPFDLVVFLNSAAPSLYAKQLQDFLIDDRYSTSKPRIVSITSTGDWATGSLHEIGNLGNRYLASDLQRKYHPKGSAGLELTAGYYYDHTPGHNPYLINGHILMDSNSPTPPAWWTVNQIFSNNIAHAGATGIFFAESTLDQKIHGFNLSPSPTNIPSNYWILTVPKDIIPWHTEIWSNSSIEMLAGIYSIVQHIPPSPKKFHSLHEN